MEMLVTAITIDDVSSSTDPQGDDFPHHTFISHLRTGLNEELKPQWLASADFVLQTCSIPAPSKAFVCESAVLPLHGAGQKIT